jgi:hypothetical protein
MLILVAGFPLLAGLFVRKWLRSDKALEWEQIGWWLVWAIVALTVFRHLCDMTS